MQEFLENYEVTLLFLVALGVPIVAAVLEMISPRRPEVDSLKYRWANNLGLAVVNQLNVTWVIAVAAVATVWMTEGGNIGIFTQVGGGLNFWAQVCLAILTLELVSYLFHRALHKVPWLWRIHAVHHSDTELDFSTVFRNHPLELLAIAPITVPLVVLLGFPPAAIIVYQVLRTTINAFAHGNIFLPAWLDGLLRWVVITPDFHRLHHSSDPRFTDSNFSPAFPLYDYLFGTASNKPFEEHETMEIGLEYFRDPADSRIDRLLLIPFVWRRDARFESAGP